ncbi:uncharacterized protein AMSG_11415 [Thecamonas trahens ATCC 50062]|uniref:Uncharacterized protein n=1 Tax=Thecamonas trahens ATCC 50062 TaxID=461836 RepID=A0A0L0DUN3_THETB|nr:hypothetical protein AMSG_11415 [Thecamonas trahens ATCC 50062]KNC55945.1 hypothetical protein AMSG_11415 [Thecamonas trahens ATCC 50062]|eukprot:XP_013752717.1 hypothetical protein AMSG_11415 [Thecamonas trahens ATCC 50062]
MLYEAMLIAVVALDWGDILDSPDRYRKLQGVLALEEGADDDSIASCMVAAFAFHFAALRQASALNAAPPPGEGDDAGREARSDRMRSILRLVAKSMQLVQHATIVAAGGDLRVPLLAGILVMWSVAFAGPAHAEIVDVAENCFTDALALPEDVPGSELRGEAHLFLGHIHTSRATELREADCPADADAAMDDAAAAIEAFLATAPDCHWYTALASLQLATTRLLKHETSDDAIANAPDDIRAGIADLTRYRAAMRLLRMWNPGQLSPDPATVQTIRVYAHISTRLPRAIPFSPCCMPTCDTLPAAVSLTVDNACRTCAAVYCSDACKAAEASAHAQLCAADRDRAGSVTSSRGWVKSAIALVAVAIVAMWLARFLAPFLFDFTALARALADSDNKPEL